MKALPVPEKPGVTRSSGERASNAWRGSGGDGGGKFGYGHVKRMVAGGTGPARPAGVRVIFALNGSEDASMPIRRAGFDVTMLEAPLSFGEIWRGRTAPELMVLDGGEGPSRAETARVEAPCRRDGRDRRRP